MLRLLLPVLLVVALTAGPAAPQSSESDRARANALWNEALVLYNQNRKAEAVARFRESLKLWTDGVRETYVARLEEGLDRDRQLAQELSAEAAGLEQAGRRTEALIKFQESQRLWPDPATDARIRALRGEPAPQPAVVVPPTNAATPPSVPAPVTSSTPTGAASPVTPPGGQTSSTTPPPATPTTTAAGDGGDAASELIPVAKGAVTRVAAAVLLQIRQILAPFGSALHYVGPKEPGDTSAVRIVFAGVGGEFLELQATVDGKDTVAVSDVSVVSLGRDATVIGRLLQEMGK